MMLLMRLHIGDYVCYSYLRYSSNDDILWLLHFEFFMSMGPGQLAQAQKVCVTKKFMNSPASIKPYISRELM